MSESLDAQQKAYLRVALNQSGGLRGRSEVLVRELKAALDEGEADWERLMDVWRDVKHAANEMDMNLTQAVYRRSTPEPEWKAEAAKERMQGNIAYWSLERHKPILKAVGEQYHVEQHASGTLVPFEECKDEICLEVLGHINAVKP